MKVTPCALCGYDAPGPRCPHCAGHPRSKSLQAPLRGRVTGILEGLLALPQGIGLFLRTPGTKRWMLPPLLLTGMLSTLLLWWLFGQLSGLMEENLPHEFSLDPSWSWLDGLSERWGWLQASWAGVVGAAQWTLNAGWGLLLSRSLRLLTWFLLGSLAMWYSFSIAYEALAGPFLDEIQGRLEERWFGIDPRSSLERPNDIPASRCTLYSSLSFGLFALLSWVAWPHVGAWGMLLAFPLSLLPACLIDARYWAWFAWVLGIEVRALVVSLQATFVTLVILVLALPLYFVPVVGYFLFAAVCGFATAVGLLDIPCERRGWSLRQRMAFLRHHLLAFMSFGVAAGMLLAIPVLGPLLMVPAASIGGAWLFCRLDKSFLRPS